jgi:hypothetical protein
METKPAINVNIRKSERQNLLDVQEDNSWDFVLTRLHMIHMQWSEGMIG